MCDRGPVRGGGGASRAATVRAGLRAAGTDTPRAAAGLFHWLMSTARERLAQSRDPAFCTWVSPSTSPLSYQERRSSRDRSMTLPSPRRTRRDWGIGGGVYRACTVLFPG